MFYSVKYNSPICDLYVVCDDIGIAGLWMDGQKYFLGSLKEQPIEQPDHPILIRAVQWLDDYFAGKQPEISSLPLNPQGSDFRKEVWAILCRIPYGQVITYGDIAREIAHNHGKEKMSAQAVGGAVGHNPISIIVPCHRVVGTNGSLTGYAGGINKKIALLKHEGLDMDKFIIPTKGTAL